MVRGMLRQASGLVRVGLAVSSGSSLVIWVLVNAEARAAAHHSFEIPPRSERESLRAGDLVKLIFVDPTAAGSSRGERLWVEITEAGTERYLGRLRSSPVLIRGLREGNLVEFRPEHVATIMAAEGEGKA